ncbi:GntR family transcriptional regulator [Kineosporia sp. A_224]|uniref:GntR family transcriptional regulator n=1 Tax=Kineosporia sp. A_224 TaxID=1962180 RepID=UPI00210186C1|nr:GntR family transcriptional regulator [Kineosporia sp. A_224]
MSTDPGTQTDAPTNQLLLRTLVLDRSSPVPLYFQVAQAMEGAISDGRLPPGSRLDNEVLLAEQLGLSRPTMRRAMQYLVDKGVLVRRRGVGTRVVQPKVRRPLGLSSLYEDLKGSGQAPSTTVLSLGPEPAPATVAEAMGIPAETLVTVLVRLRSAGDRPIARMCNYLPHTVPGLAEGLTASVLEEHGLYEVIRGLGIQLHAADQSIGARTATAEEARLLKEPRGAALLTMQRIAYDDHGRVVEFGSHIYAASRYSFELSMLAG